MSLHLHSLDAKQTRVPSHLPSPTEKSVKSSNVCFKFFHGETLHKWESDPTASPGITAVASLESTW